VRGRGTKFGDGSPMPFKDPQRKLNYNRRRTAEVWARAAERSQVEYLSWLLAERRRLRPPIGVTKAQWARWLDKCLSAFEERELV
jgi:hypothetical protein